MDIQRLVWPEIDRRPRYIGEHRPGMARHVARGDLIVAFDARVLPGFENGRRDAEIAVGGKARGRANPAENRASDNSCEKASD